MCTVKTSPTSAKKEAEGRVLEVWQGRGVGGVERADANVIWKN